MWLVLVAAALSCGSSSEELHLRVLDAQGVAIPGAEVRKWSGEEPREPLLGVSDPSGSLTTCIPAGLEQLGVYHPGFTPKMFARRPGELVVVTLQKIPVPVSVEPGLTPPCVTGSTKDGYRFCADILSRLPLQF